MIFFHVDDKTILMSNIVFIYKFKKITDPIWFLKNNRISRQIPQM